MSCKECGGVAMKDIDPFDHNLCPECYCDEAKEEDKEGEE